MSDLENLIEILNLIGVEDDWYSNEEIAEKLIAHGVKYVLPTLKSDADDMGRYDHYTDSFIKKGGAE